MTSKAATIHQVGFYLSLATVALLPLFFLPFTPDYYEFAKNTLFILLSLLLLTLTALGFVFNKQIRMVRSPFGLPLLVLATTWLLSTLLKSPNRTDALLEAGQTGTIIALSFFFFSLTNFIHSKKESDLLSHVLISSVSLLGFVGIVWGSGIYKFLPFLPDYIKSPLWTPAGPTLSAVISLVSLVPFLIFTLAKQKSVSIKSYLLAAALFINIAGAGFLTFRLFNPPSDSPKLQLLPARVGWSVALESLKVSPILGTGPSTFISDFTQFKPLNLNLTPQWNLRFTTSSNFYLQTLTTVGFLGLAASLFLVIRIWKVAIKSLFLPHSATGAALISALALSAIHLFLPATFLSLFFLFTYLSIAIASLKTAGSTLTQDTNIDIVASSESLSTPILPLVSLIGVVMITIPSLFLLARAYTADVYFQRALLSAANNDGKTAYDSLLTAIKTNPYRDSYRVTYSQINFLIANSLAANKDLTDTDRNTISQLIQQSIREAKNAVALNPAKVSNVENLASIYQNLLNFAQGADAWTVASYRQAIALDPGNPTLRIALGGTLYSQKDYDGAIRIFQQAVDLKPDLANAHYNLSVAYREKGELNNALTAMQAVVQLIDKSSPDYDKAKSELEELQKKVGSASTPTPTPSNAASQLSQPQPLPTPKVNPPIELDQSLSPESPATPSPNP